MKRGKDEEKIMGPMFPRLHVNDTEKGGPKAPPRNKMALYEQLSIPSQRFNHSNNNKPANSEPPSNQGIGNKRGMFRPYQLPARRGSEKPYSHYSDFSIPLTQVEQRKKLDEDDFRVPIFVHSLQNQERCKYASNLNREKLSPSNPPNFNQPVNFHKFKKTGTLESTIRQESKSQKEENSKEIPTYRVIATSTEKAEGLKKQHDSSVCHEPREYPVNDIDRSETHDLVEPDLHADSQCVLGENISASDKINSSDPVRAFPSEDQKGFQDRFRSVHKRSLERGNFVHEASILDSINRLDMTPDDVVGIMGQKRFWKARKTILNQQRIFAVQVFELHRLIKVQKLIAASPQLMADGSSYLGRPTKAPPGAKIALNCPIKTIQNVLKEKGEPEKPSQKKESSTENTIRKPSFSSFQSGATPPTYRPSNGPVSTNPIARPWCFNQPQGHQWLIPVMSPSEGLVYKLYPGPGIAVPACNGFGPPSPNPITGSFQTPAYGIPAPPSFPPAGPHGYFPTYGVPITTGATVSGSSVEQPNPPPNPSQTSAGDLHHHQKNQASPDALNNSLYASKDTEVQASTASSPVERLRDSRLKGDDAERTNVLPLFPMAPATVAPPNCSPNHPKPDRPTQVIKVVPHNARSATESAARIFQSIQEERKQFDSV